MSEAKAARSYSSSKPSGKDKYSEGCGRRFVWASSSDKVYLTDAGIQFLLEPHFEDKPPIEYAIMKPHSTSKRARFKTTLKDLNPFKSKGKQSESNPPSIASSASASVQNVSGVLDPTIQAEPRASISIRSTPLSQILSSDVTREADAQMNSTQASAHSRGTTSDDIAHGAKIHSDPRSDANPKESLVPAVAVTSTHGLHQSSSSSAGRTVWNATRNVVDVVGQAADAFPPLKSVVGGIMAILKTYDQIKGNKEKSDSLLRRLESLDLPESEKPDVKELERRSKLSRALEPIHQELSRIAAQSLLQRAANNVQDNETVSSCVEDLRDALTDYQVSLQHDLQRIGRESITKVDRLLLAQLPRAKDARYLSGNHEKCLKGTRIDVLEEIWAWAIDFSVARAYWLNGIAGSGKSTIAQTFAEWCFAEGLLGASFFCSRDSKERSDIKLIFPTLAFQLAERYPEFREALISTLGANSDIGYASLTEQLERLLLEPLKSTGLSTVIVIDALDECKDEEATSSILSVLGRIVHEIPSVRIFITGRPEPRVRSGFRLPLFRSHTEVFRLHEVQPAIVDEDIRTYLRIKLPETIQNRSDLDVSDSWPAETDIAVLVRKCSSLFIFAATTYKFVKFRLGDPRDSLQLVVNLPDDTRHEGLSGIDSLYTNILQNNYSHLANVDQTALEFLQEILGAVVTAFSPVSRVTLGNLIGQDVTPSKILTSLRDLHSLLFIPEKQSDSIRIYHKSFSDYLTKPLRCRNVNFYINLDVHHAMMAKRCLEVLERKLDAKRNMCGLPRYAINKDVVDLSARRENHIGDTLEYACRFWAQHLHHCGEVGEDVQKIAQLLKNFFEKHLLSWLEVLSVTDNLRTAVHSLAFLKEWLAKVQHSDPSLSAWVNDAERYVLYSFDAIQQSAPHIYESSIFWLPSSSLVRQRYSNHLGTTTKLLGGINPAWDRCTRTIRAGSWANSVVFSGDGKLIGATGQDGKTGFLRVYEAATGIPVVTVERNDDELYFAAFSHNSSLVFAGSHDYKIMAWDLQTGGLVRIYEGHKDPVITVAMSPNGTSMASGSHDHGVRIWDIASGNCTCVLEGHTSSVFSVCWSPEGDKLYSGSYDNTVKVWDPVTALCLNTAKPHNIWIRSMAYSPNSSSFASGSVDKTIKLYDSYTGAVLQTIPAGSYVNSVSFSPCKKHILCGTDNSSFIWDVEKQDIVAQFDQARINCIAFSPTGTSIVSGSQDGVLRVWQVPGDAHGQPSDASDHPSKSVVKQIVCSSDGELLVSGSEDGTIIVWNAATNSCTHTFVGHTDAIQTLAFSPDGALLVSGSYDRTVRVWDVREKRQLWVLEGHNSSSGTYSVQFISNGTQILSQSRDSINLWNIETGKMLATMRGGGYDTDGVQIISGQDYPGSTHWAIQNYKFKHFLASGLPVGFVPIQDRENIYDELPKPQHRYRYSLEDGCILDQRHRTISWSAREQKWVWSDQDPSAGERFKVYDPFNHQGEGLNEEWVVDREGRRIFWMPQDRRGPSSNWGKKLAIGLEDGRVMTLDFTDVQS